MIFTFDKIFEIFWISTLCYFGYVLYCFIIYMIRNIADDIVICRQQEMKNSMLSAILDQQARARRK